MSYRLRMVVIAFLSLSLSVLVTVLIYRVLKNRISPPTETGRVIVATSKLALGTRLTEQHLRAVVWPKATPIEGSFADPKELIGRGVIIPIAPNEPVLESKLAPREGGAGLTSAIPEGMRAVSVKVDDVIGVAGFVLPGTRVDVIVTGSPNRNGEIDTSKVILENVQVLAAGQNVEQDVNGKPQNVQVVTLLVAPEGAQKLALASTDGRIQLALRNPLDLEQSNPAALQKSALFNSASPPTATISHKAPPKRAIYHPGPATAEVAAPPPAPRTLTVELIQGDKRESLEFEPK